METEETAVVMDLMEITVAVTEMALAVEIWVVIWEAAVAEDVEEWVDVEIIAISEVSLIFVKFIESITINFIN